MSDNRLDTLVAESAIRRLISSYCDAVGRLDADAAAALFAPDARIQIAHLPEFVGRDAIAEGLRQIFAGLSFLHMKCDSGLLDVEQHAARARLSVLEINREAARADELGLIAGYYEDEYAWLSELGWKFYRRRYSLQSYTVLPISSLRAAGQFVPMLAIAS